MSYKPNDRINTQRSKEVRVADLQVDYEFICLGCHSHGLLTLEIRHPMMFTCPHGPSCGAIYIQCQIEQGDWQIVCLSAPILRRGSSQKQSSRDE